MVIKTLQIGMSLILDKDNFYDIGRIVRKGNAVAPTGRLTVVYNYFEHGAGDFFTVDSYSIDYKEIPTYTATRATQRFVTFCEFDQEIQLTSDQELLMQP